MPNQPTSNATLLWGDDGFRIAEEVLRLAPVLEDGLGDLNRVVLDGQKLAPIALAEQTQSLPFLADRKTIIVHALVGRFEKDNRSKSRQAEIVEFRNAIVSTPPSTMVVLVDGKLDTNKNPLAQALRDSNVRFREFPFLPPGQLRTWVQQRFDSLGARVFPTAIGMLADTVGPNLWVMRSEVDKLALYADGRPIDDSMVQELVSSAREANIFNVIDSILMKRTSLALRQIDDLIDASESPFAILALVLIRIRQAWIVAERIELGDDARTARAKAGLAYIGDRGFEQILRLSRDSGAGRLAEAHATMLAIDVALKTGKAEPRLGLELFTVSGLPPTTVKP